MSNNISRQGIDNIKAALSELKDLGDHVLGVLNNLNSIGSSPEALDKTESVLDDAQDILNEMEDLLGSIMESLDELKDMVDDRRDNLDETEGTDI